MLQMKSKHFNKEEDVIDELYDLACSHNQRINYYTTYIIEGMRFHIKELKMQRQTQNSGIATIGYEG